jgi:Fe-S-cluster-containing dehydrogenase component/Ni/Fe-hydrogenase subunit HybB-like protein
MRLGRRTLLKLAGATGSAAVALPARSRGTVYVGTPGAGEAAMLVDTTLCVGCRACEAACAEANGLADPPAGDVFGETRLTSSTALTVVNRLETPEPPGARYVKRQCMHCVEPACASACPVRALEKLPSGPVTYHPGRCMGCRYCMVACPFEVPKYEYEKAIPAVKKCTFCAARQEQGLRPACAEVCPSGALTFGRRGELLEEARRRIYRDPDRYVHHVYGEHEAGGTDWLYLSGVDFDRLGLNVRVDDASYPDLVKGALSVPPFVMTLWPPLLLGLYAISHRRGEAEEAAAAGPADERQLSLLEPAAPRGPRPYRAWLREKLLLGKGPREYLRSLLTPVNALAAAVCAVGFAVLGWRFLAGLGSTTNLSQTQPWGLWIGFDMMCGIALAAGGFTIGAAVEILNLEEYHPVQRPAILTAFLGYLIAIVGLLADLGKPWNMVQIFAQPGTRSILFEVAWCVALYSIVLALEFAIPLFEWLGIERFYRPLRKALLALSVLAVVFSTMHQSALGSLFIIAPAKLHPLWWSPWLFVLFFVSAVAAGLSMVVVESTLSHRIFARQLRGRRVDVDALTLGLGKAAALVLFAYFFLKLHGVADNHAWGAIGEGFLGVWWIVEMLGFVLLPSLLYAYGARVRSVKAVRVAAVVTTAGIVLNRLNVSIVAWDYANPHHYVPAWMELAVSAALVTVGVLAFRWIVNRMPILHEAPGPGPGAARPRGSA